jgi:hypothetical protein
LLKKRRDGIKPFLARFQLRTLLNYCICPKPKPHPRMVRLYFFIRSYLASDRRFSRVAAQFTDDFQRGAPESRSHDALPRKMPDMQTLPSRQQKQLRRLQQTYHCHRGDPIRGPRQAIRRIMFAKRWRPSPL